jgi:hypothetical protein
MARFRAIFRRPLSNVIAPTLGVIALIQILLGPSPASGNPIIADLYTDVKTKNWGGMTVNAGYVPQALTAGLTQALPSLLGAALAGLAGRIFKI